VILVNSNQSMDTIGDQEYILNPDPSRFQVGTRHQVPLLSLKEQQMLSLHLFQYLKITM